GPGVEFQDGGGQLVEPGDDLHRVGQVLGAADGGGDRFGQWPAGAGLQQQYGGQRPTQDGRGGAAALGEHGVPPGQAGELLLGQDLQIAGATVGGVADHGAAGGPVAEQVAAGGGAGLLRTEPAGHSAGNECLGQPGQEGVVGSAPDAHGVRPPAQDGHQIGRATCTDRG